MGVFCLAALSCALVHGVCEEGMSVFCFAALSCALVHGVCEEGLSVFCFAALSCTLVHGVCVNGMGVLCVDVLCCSGRGSRAAGSIRMLSRVSGRELWCVRTARGWYFCGHN
jgi:hypothetical protein